MQRISVYIPEDTRKRINIVSKAKLRPEAEIIRAALDKGLKEIHSTSSSAQALLNFAKLAEQIPTKPGSPNDVSENHDYYAWGGKKRHEE